MGEVSMWAWLFFGAITLGFAFVVGMMVDLVFFMPRRFERDLQRLRAGHYDPDWQRIKALIEQGREEAKATGRVVMFEQWVKDRERKG